MPNGKPGDNPITDLMIHGSSGMPNEIEMLIRRLWELQRPNFKPHDALWDEIYRQSNDWLIGKNVKEGIALLERCIVSVSGGNPKTDQ